MPSIAALHPQIVHFAVALLVIGVLFRAIALTHRFPFTGAAATTLILLGTVATVLAVISGDQAHGPVERVPGVRAAVTGHEEWGERARNAFIVVALVDLVALGLTAAKNRYARYATMTSAVVGVLGLVVLYQAAVRGGELVYGYAGGVGIRSGNPEDVNRLLIAGVFHQATLDQQSGNGTASTQLVDATARRFPDHVELQLFAAEWQTDVENDPLGAMQRLDNLPIAQAEAPLRVRAGLARANALVAQGNIEGARAVLQTLLNESPTNQQIQRRLDELAR